MAKRRGRGEGSIVRRKDGLWQVSVDLGCALMAAAPEVRLMRQHRLKPEGLRRPGRPRG
jgi:hypothetical protein